MGVYCTEIDHILQDLPRLLIKMKYKDTTCQNQNVTSANSRTNGGSERRISFMATFDTEGAMCNATPTISLIKQICGTTSNSASNYPDIIIS